MGKVLRFNSAVFVVLAFLVSVATAADDYPLRAKYPDVKIISTDDLARNFGNIIIVDVRSTMEYDVAHVNGAKHVSLSTASFATDLEGVRPKNGTTPLAFYCNGHTCAKSYKAYIAANEAGFTNLLAYDSGIFDWIIANPDKATLMDTTPAPTDKIIPKAVLKKRMIQYADFKARAAGGNAMVIDIRDPFQRKVTPDLPNIRNIPMDRLLILLKKKQFADKDLLIFDAVGKQVEWLQYYLEKNEYKEYSFLEKGVEGAK